MTLILDTCEVTYTFRPSDDDRFMIPGTEVNAIDVRCNVVTDDGDPYLYTDVTLYGWALTKTGARNKTRGHGPLYGVSPYAFPGRDDDWTPSDLITKWVGPAMRDVVLVRHPEFAGLPIEGSGPLGEWIAKNPAVAQ